MKQGRRKGNNKRNTSKVVDNSENIFFAFI